MPDLDAAGARRQPGWPAVASCAPSFQGAFNVNQVTDAIAVSQSLALKREALRRYVRVVATTAGSGIDVTFAASVSFVKKYF